MVFLVYNPEKSKYYGIFENEEDAIMIARSYSLDLNENWVVLDLPYFKKLESKFHYSEEDPDFDEE